MQDYDLIKVTLYVVLGIYAFIVLMITLYNINKKGTLTQFYNSISFNGFLEFIAIIVIIVLVALNETINAFTALGFIVLFIKTIISIITINNIKYYDSNVLNNFLTNIMYIFSKEKKPEPIEVLNNYLPLAILNGFLMMTLYIYTVTILRVDLSLATNCIKSNFNVEYSTIRHKVRTFAKKYNGDLKKYLGILIISFAFAILSICYIYYYRTVELHYILLLPILLFMIVFAIMLLDKIDGENLGKDTTKTDNGINSILLTAAIVPMIGFISLAFLI